MYVLRTSQQNVPLVFYISYHSTMLQIIEVLFDEIIQCPDNAALHNVFLSKHKYQSGFHAICTQARQSANNWMYSVHPN